MIKSFENETWLSLERYVFLFYEHIRRKSRREEEEEAQVPICFRWLNDFGFIPFEMGAL